MGRFFGGARRLQGTVVGAMLCMLGISSAGCVYYYEDEHCAYNAYADSYGHCVCEAGYAGDPYYECIRCGDHTDVVWDDYYGENICVCRHGYAGDPYSAEGCEVAPQWWVADFCDDGLDVQWRLFAQDADYEWPGDGGVFVTPGFGQDQYESTYCIEGESICFGGIAGDLEWGVGINGDLPCEDCCFSCEPVTHLIGELTCN